VDVDGAEDSGVGRRDASRLGRQRGRRSVEWIGHLDEARAELATAVAMLREMGMAFWLPEAEAELARCDEPLTSTSA
jgi:hypothetical protein